MAWLLLVAAGIVEIARAAALKAADGEPGRPPAGAEFQKPFMRKWLQFIGIEVVEEIVIGPTLDDAHKLSELLARCKRRARTAAQVL